MGLLNAEKVKLLAPGAVPVSSSATQSANTPDGVVMWEGFASLKSATFAQSTTTTGMPDQRLWSGRIMRLQNVHPKPKWKLVTDAGQKFLIANVSVSTHIHLDLEEIT